MKKILLTGASGYLGGSLVKRLVNDYRVFALMREHSSTRRLAGLVNEDHFVRSKLEDVERFFSVEKPDVVIHCATAYDRGNPRPLGAITEANLVLPLELLKLAVTHGTKAFINADTIVHPQTNAYALAKAQFREWLKHYGDQIVAINLCMDHFYGPGDDPTKFVTWLVHQLLVGVPSLDLTLGEQKRDFTYIDDVVAAFLQLIEFSQDANIGFHAFEMGTERKVTIKDFVLMVQEVVGNRATKFHFGALPYRDYEIMDHPIDASRLMRLGWLPKTTLEAGLPRLVEFERGVVRD